MYIMAVFSQTSRVEMTVMEVNSYATSKPKRLEWKLSLIFYYYERAADQKTAVRYNSCSVATR